MSVLVALSAILTRTGVTATVSLVETFPAVIQDVDESIDEN